MSDITGSRNLIDPKIFEHPLFKSERAALEAVLKVCDTYPDKVNPMVDHACVYDDEQGNHCLIGQMLVDNGLSLPKTNNTIRLVIEKTATVPWGVEEILSKAQRFADSTGNNKGKLRTWGEVGAEVRDLFGAVVR